eukprot:SAG31_NODE_1808_length_7230_cov_32.785835_5_plen_69_part_00
MLEAPRHCDGTGVDSSTTSASVSPAAVAAGVQAVEALAEISSALSTAVRDFRSKFSSYVEAAGEFFRR